MLNHFGLSICHTELISDRQTFSEFERGNSMLNQEYLGKYVALFKDVIDKIKMRDAQNFDFLNDINTERKVQVACHLAEFLFIFAENDADVEQFKTAMRKAYDFSVTGELLELAVYYYRTLQEIYESIHKINFVRNISSQNTYVSQLEVAKQEVIDESDNIKKLFKDNSAWLLVFNESASKSNSRLDVVRSNDTFAACISS